MSTACRRLELLSGLLFQAYIVACSASAAEDTPSPSGGSPPAAGGLPSTGGQMSSTGGSNSSTGGTVSSSAGVPNAGTGGSAGDTTTIGGMHSGGFSTGGTLPTSGATSGGASGTGGGGGSGTAGTGGSGTGGSGTGGSTSGAAGPTKTCGCLQSAGEYSGNPIGSTIVVDGGEVFDGKCMTFRASNALGDGGVAEGQKPIFIINNGTIQNVIINTSAADGIHIEGDATLKNVHWLDIGEDAMSVGGGVTTNPIVNLDCGSSQMGNDKTFQVNAPSTWNVTNFTSKTAQKFMRQNGGSTFKMTVNIDHCDIADMREAIYRTDSKTAVVNMTNTRYRSIGKALFVFGETLINGDTHEQVGQFTGNVKY